MNFTISRRATAFAIAIATGSGVAAISSSGMAQAAPAAHHTAAQQAKAQVGAVTYADRLVRAWGRGDHAAARYYTTHAVHRTLFGQADPGGSHWRRTSVAGAAGTIYVTYHDDALGGTLRLAVDDVGLHDGDPAHAVDAARFRNEPRTVGALEWSDRLIRAWGSGHRGDVAYYANEHVTTQLFEHANPGGPHWNRVGWQGAAGTIYITYRNTATGSHVTVGVSDVELGQGEAHAAYRVHFW